MCISRPCRAALLRMYALAGAFYFAFSMMAGWNKVAQGDTLAGALFAASLLLVLALPVVFLMWLEAFRRDSFLKRILKAGAGNSSGGAGA